jgi:hypothetical protein
MKKLVFFAVVLAAVGFAACGNKNVQNTEVQDSVKSFEQEQIEASIKMHFDSLAAELSKLKELPVMAKDGAVVLTAAEKQVKPDFLLNPSIADEATTLAEKYRALTALQTDKQIAKLYDMATDDYDKAIAKLAADIDDPSFKAIEEGANLTDNAEALYNAMNENGRINYFWQIAATSLVEQLYATSQNSDKFVKAFTDETASNSTFRLVLILDAIDRLKEYDPEIAPVAEALKPLEVLNAMTVDEMKAQLTEAKDKIAGARKAILK